MKYEAKHYTFTIMFKTFNGAILNDAIGYFSLVTPPTIKGVAQLQNTDTITFNYYCIDHGIPTQILPSTSIVSAAEPIFLGADLKPVKEVMLTPEASIATILYRSTKPENVRIKGTFVYNKTTINWDPELEVGSGGG